jgi:serine/threonine-protein phosphatase PP1 catalytic subunit
MMSIAAVISNRIFCVHGGISGPVKLLEITKEDAYPFVWNDSSEMDGIGKSPRGLGMRTFGEEPFAYLPMVYEQIQNINKH